MPRPATRDEIRRHLGHGRGNRRVYLTPDGSVLVCGSIFNDRNAPAPWWANAGRIDDFEVLDDVAGVVKR